MTRPQNANLIPAKPGEIRNPNGRPKGSRNKLGEAFLTALHDDFVKSGIAAIERVRADRPDVYLKVIAQVVPKELLVRDASIEDMTDDELIEFLAAVRSANASSRRKEDKPRAKPKAREEGPGETGRPH